MALLSRKKEVLGLLGWLALVCLVAAIGSVASFDAAPYYNSLQRPGWAPPSGIFGPMWSLLYLLMAIAAWLVWRSDDHQLRRPALVLFVVQLVLNMLWSWLFFAWQSGVLSFIDIIVLWLLLSATIVVFAKVHLLAAALLVPYWLWVSYAAALNYSVWKLNPQWLG